jgi:hypothetical protein
VPEGVIHFADWTVFVENTSASPASRATVIAAINAAAGTSDEWPLFMTQEIGVVTYGGKQTVRLGRSATNDQSSTPTSSSLGSESGYSQDAEQQLEIRRDVIRPTLHDTISITPHKFGITYPLQALCTAEITGDFGTGTTTAYASSNADVLSTSGLSATTPAAYPVAGSYILTFSQKPYRNGMDVIIARVFDASQLA